MTGYLIDYNGNEYCLPLLLSWSVTHGLGTPCDAFELSLVYDRDMADILQKTIKFRGVFENETVFHGVVDEYEISVDENGSTASISGRGMAAYLLDNEAGAVEYWVCTLGDILNNHVYPFGIQKVKADAMGSAFGYTVESGASQWTALYNFTKYVGNIAPRFSKDGVLILSAAEGDKLVINDWSGAFDLKYCGKRYGVISEVLVKNKALNTSTVVRNEKFIAQGGSCRRVVNVPRNTSYDKMRYTGKFQIDSSEEEQVICSVSLPSQFAAFPNDIVTLQMTQTGIAGEFRVSETTTWANGDSAGTEIKMIKK